MAGRPQILPIRKDIRPALSCRQPPRLVWLSCSLGHHERLRVNAEPRAVLSRFRKSGHLLSESIMLRKRPLMSEDKPYRPNVGIALFNASGQVLIGRRFRDDGPEIILPGLEWQMPQGGIDADENPRDAVMRELWEETGAVSAEHLGETGWMTYEFPPYDGPPG